MNVFFINNALNVKQLSVYSNEERFKQTLETIDSIDKYAPGSLKYMFDSSPEEPNEDYIKQLNDRNVSVIYLGGIEIVKAFSNSGARSLAECISFSAFVGWFMTQGIEVDRVYKLSGRYRLNENFVLNDPSYKDAFVFSDALDSWMPDEKKKSAGVDKLYRLRLWHMDGSLLKTFHDALPEIFKECYDHGIDVEHAYYKKLHLNKVVEVNKIGVCGNIAPSGDYIDE